MKKELLIGGLATASAAIIIGGIYVAKSNPFGLNESADSAQEDQRKIEQLWYDELKDTSKYSFCLGEMKINSVHSDKAFAANGIVDYSSKELILYNKESNKLFIMSRQLKYKYDGILGQSLGGIKIDVPVKEYGSLTEVYSRNELPLRIDYNGKYIVTDPDTENKQWVSVIIDEEASPGLPHHGCSGVYQLDNSPGHDLLADGDHIIIDRKCNETAMGAIYDGDFSFSCSMIDYKNAMDLLEINKAEMALQNPDKESFNSSDSSATLDDASASGRSEGANGPVDGELNQSIGNQPPTSEDIKRQIEEMKRETQADAGAIR
ncbi:MAG: hypothetical protein WC473_02235 [Patescibacteria group bacterium]